MFTIWQLLSLEGYYIEEGIYKLHYSVFCASCHFNNGWFPYIGKFGAFRSWHDKFNNRKGILELTYGDIDYKCAGYNIT